MSDNEIARAFNEFIKNQEDGYTTCLEYGGKRDSQLEKELNLFNDVLDLINRQKAEIEKFKSRQKPTGASGYKIENGKVVFFTNMLGGYRYEHKDLEETVKTLNELLQECYSKDEIAFALKCKTEDLKTAKTEAYKEMADILTAKFIHIFRLEESNRRYLKRVVELTLKDMLGKEDEKQ